MILSRWFSAIPISILCGISFYYQFTQNFSLELLVSLVIILAAISQKTQSIVSYILTFLVLGYLAAQFNELKPNYKQLDQDIYVEDAISTIKKIEHMHQYTRITLDKVRKFKNVRIVVRTKTYEKMRPGDIIMTSMKLHPPPGPVTENGYDFARFAYFQNIEAIGFATKPIKLQIRGRKNTFRENIMHLRHRIDETFKQNMSYPASSIASALMVGKREGIDKNTMENIRKAGLAHLLAISGLHISLVASLFFISTNYIVLRYTKLSIKYETNKIAAIISIIGSGVYLLLTQYPVSAQRAFIMSTIIFIGILMNRQTNSIRSISIAAITIMLLKPESTTQPSFQMSFMAVIALCSFYEKLSMKSLSARYLIAIFTSSLLASLATLPYTLYHFNYFSLGGLISNFIAIPLTTFIIIPCGIIALLAPISQPILFKAMEHAINILIESAQYVANLPHSIVYYHSFSGLSLFFISIGMLILCLTSNKYKATSLPVLIIGIILAANYKIPDVFMHKQCAAIRSSDGLIYFLSNKQRKNFITNSWMLQNGQKDLLLIKNYYREDIKHEENQTTFYKEGNEFQIDGSKLYFKGEEILDIENFTQPCFLYVYRNVAKIKGCTTKNLNLISKKENTD